jgi:hypothetical protein
MSNLTVPRPIASHASKQFKRDGKGGSRTICYHCGHKIDDKPKDGITLRRISHLKVCENYTYESPEVVQSYDKHDEDVHKPDEIDQPAALDDAAFNAVLELLEYHDEGFPDPNDINPEDKHDATFRLMPVTMFV